MFDARHKHSSSSIMCFSCLHLLPGGSTTLSEAITTILAAKWTMFAVFPKVTLLLFQMFV